MSGPLMALEAQAAGEPQGLVAYAPAEADEEQRRRDWIQYYVDTGDYTTARTLGWKGEAEDEDAPASAAPGSDAEGAATTIQKTYRGWSRRHKYKDERDDAARLQWVEYYVQTKQYDLVRDGRRRVRSCARACAHGHTRSRTGARVRMGRDGA